MLNVRYCLSNHFYPTPAFKISQGVAKRHVSESCLTECYQRTPSSASRRRTVWKSDILSKLFMHSSPTELHNDSLPTSTILPIEILDSPEDLSADVLRDLLPELHAIIFVIDINVSVIHLMDKKIGRSLIVIRTNGTLLSPRSAILW